MTLLDLTATLRARYQKLDPVKKRKVEARIRIVGAMSATPQNQWESKAAALAAELAVTHGRGFSAKRIKDIFRDYRARGAEAILLNYGKKTAKPKAFLAELGRRVENNTRVSSPAINGIRADWFAGKDIPGYGNWRDAWRAEHGAEEPEPAACPDWFAPKGFSERQLSRLVPSAAELEYARRGLFAAHGKLPQKRNDYRSLMPLQIVVFDDVRCDWLVSYPGAAQASEMWLLVAMDASTRCVLDWVSLARVPDDEGKRAEFIGEHMLILASNIIRRSGIPTGWTMTLKVENAKATINREKADYLATMSGGQIEVDYTVMHNRKLASGRTERHGTPWDIKGILESFFKTFHNHTAALPGNTGARYDLAPAELKDRQDELKAILKEAEGLPPEIIAQLRLPFLRYAEAIDAVERVMQFLNNRHDHTLQGFSKIELFRLPKDTAWRPVDELARYDQDTIRTAIFETRLESPRQRFDKLFASCPEFRSVPDEALIPFLAKTVKRVRHPAAYTIEWAEGGVTWTYRAELPELNGKRAGKDFFVRYLSANVSAAWLYDADTGAQLGVMQRVNIAAIGDDAAQKAAVGEVVHVRSLVTKAVDDRHAGERAQREDDHRINDAIIEAARNGGAMVEQAKQATKTTRKETAAQADRNAARSRQMADRAAAQIATQ